MSFLQRFVAFFQTIRFLIPSLFPSSVLIFMILSINVIRK